MEPSEATRLASYLQAAAEAGLLTPARWQGWADRMIAAGELDGWILDVRLASSRDHLQNSLAPVLPDVPDVEAYLGHLWRLCELGQMRASHFLYLARRESEGLKVVSPILLELQQLFRELEECDEESIYEDRIVEFVAERRLVEKSREQWRALFPLSEEYEGGDRNRED